MISFEQEVREWLIFNNATFVDNSLSYKLPDYTILRGTDKPFQLEVKEKRQSYAMHNWPTTIPEPNLFIVDELTVRKLLYHSPLSGMLVRDNTSGLYYFFSVLDLALVPVDSCNRVTNYSGTPGLKGKWLVSFVQVNSAFNLSDAFKGIRDYVKDHEDLFLKHTPLYGRWGVKTCGSVRDDNYRQHDVAVTR